MIHEYFGPKLQISVAQLATYDNGMYVCEEKIDGQWAKATTDDKGTIISLTSRVGKTFSGSAVNGLIGLNIRLANSVLIGELEHGTEAAIRRQAGSSVRRLHIFDVVQLLGTSTVSLPFHQRRKLLELALSNHNDAIHLVENRTGDFITFYEEIITRGGEGLVVKKIDSKYGSGKSEAWIRCKPVNCVDYVVMSVGRSPGGSSNLQVGLYVGDKLKRVATIKAPPRGDLKALVGRVIECRGAEIHASGVLRHAAFVRVRDDKEPKDCIL
jgi:ATP-dependent DNA ligase